MAKRATRCGGKALFDLRLVDFSVLMPAESTSHNAMLRRVQPAPAGRRVRLRVNPKRAARAHRA